MRRVGRLRQEPRTINMEDKRSGRPILRSAGPSDVVAIADLHFAAVHQTAATAYSPDVLESWSRRPDESRYQEVRAAIAGGDELFLVAEIASEVVAFGSVVPRLRELRAVYVHPTVGRRGIGSQILAALERLALAAGMVDLQMDASVNAEAFYRRAGYEVVKRGTHRLSTGHEMACVRMAKGLGRQAGGSV
jgi:putative acetyltransferase